MLLTPLLAGKQIRNVAAVGGNIMTGSPISDLNPIFLAAGCRLRIGSVAGEREISFDENFFTGYRRNVVQPHELLLSLKIPFTREDQHFVAYKQSKRRDDDIAIVNSAFWLTLRGDTVAEIRMAFGGMAPVTKLALRTARALAGRTFERGIVEVASRELVQEFQLPADVPGAMVRYRQSLVLSFFFKFFLTVTRQRGGDIAQSETSATEVFTKAAVTSNQLYQKKVAATDTDIVGAPLQHAAADKQVSGRAVYVDDLARVEGELYAGLVTSTRPHARIRSVDTRRALALPGVVDWVDHSCVAGDRNRFATAITRDELVFAEGEVFCVGMVIGAVVARDQDTAQRAARLVAVEYEDLPAIVTMEQAIAAGSYHAWPNNKIETGDVDSVLASCGPEQVVAGEMRTGAQEHFYLETQATIAIPSGEDGEMKIIASTQNPTLTQLTVASVLGVMANKVNSTTTYLF